MLVTTSTARSAQRPAVAVRNSAGAFWVRSGKPALEASRVVGASRPIDARLAIDHVAARGQPGLGFTPPTDYRGSLTPLSSAPWRTLAPTTARGREQTTRPV